MQNDFLLKRKGSVLKNTKDDPRSRRKTSTCTNKKVQIFDPDSKNAKTSTFRTNNNSALDKTRAICSQFAPQAEDELSVNKKRRRFFSGNTLIVNSSKRMKLIDDDTTYAEVLESNGWVRKEKIKGEIRKEFSNTRNNQVIGEYIKAQEFSEKNKENDEWEDYIEDTMTNTMRNQFVGKLKQLDEASSRAPLKHVDNSKHIKEGNSGGN